jgi:hypothetical protein
MRRALAALCLGALVAACTSGPPPAPAPAATSSPDASPVPSPGTPQPTAVGDAAVGGGSRTRSSDRRPPVTVPSDDAPLGALCRTYLGEAVPRLVVEVDWQDGARNTKGAVSHLVDVLRSVVRKPGGVTRTGGLTGPGDPDRVWTVDDLRRESNRVRGHRTTPQQAAMHVLFLRGRYAEEGVIGIAYSASQIAVFPDTIDSLSILLGGQLPVQRSVLVHEAGHLLCLVNVTYRSHHDREDPAHPHHSSDRESVMFWAIDTTAIGTLFSGPPPDDFTAQDRDDLRRLAVGEA